MISSERDEKNFSSGLVKMTISGGGGGVLFFKTDSGTKKWSVKNLKTQSADPSRPAKIWQNRDPTRHVGL